MRTPFEGILFMDSNQKEFDLSRKVAIVTGAGRGIGYHIALALAKYGADLALCSRTMPELEAVAGESKRTGSVPVGTILGQRR